eukprot:SAG11_NODE_12388_length_706_cov_0.668863_1_plen_38_part_10
MSITVDSTVALLCHIDPYSLGLLAGPCEDAAKLLQPGS